jgi:hypothetical protein
MAGSFASAIKKPGTKKTYGFYVGLGGKSFYASTEPVFISGGSNYGYGPFVKSHSDITFRMEWGNPVFEISDITVTFINDRMYPWDDQYNYMDMMADVWVHGVELRAYILVQDTDGTWYEKRIWDGVVVDCFWQEPENTVVMRAKPLLELEKYVPVRKFYTGAPDRCRNEYEPIVFGDYTTNPTNKERERMGLFDPTYTGPLACEYTYQTGNAHSTFTAARHRWKEFGTQSTKRGVYLKGQDEDVLIFEDDTLYQNNSANPEAWTASPQISPNWDCQAMLPMIPETYSSNNTATDPMKACDKDITTYATVDQSNLMLALPLKRPYDYGELIYNGGGVSIKVQAMFLVDSVLTGGAAITFGLYDLDNSQWFLTTSTTLSSSQTNFMVTRNYSTGVTNVSDLPENMELRAQMTGASGDDYGHIKACCLCCAFQLNERVMTDMVNTPWKKMFVQGKGFNDDNAGQYTGTTNALIELPSSVIHMMLKRSQWANVRSTRIEAGTGNHGNFVDVRSDLSGDNVKIAHWMSKQRSVRQVILDVCRNTGTALVINQDRKFGIVYWGSPRSRNAYSPTITGTDIFKIKCGYTPCDKVRNNIYVKYAFSHLYGKFMKEAFCTGTSSDDGEGTDDYTEKTKLSVSESAFGVKPFTLTATWIREKDAAVAVRNMMADLWYQPRCWVQVLLPLRYYDIEMGKIVAFDNETMQEVGLKHPNYLDATRGLWEGATQKRYFWVMRVSFKANSMVELYLLESDYLT